MTTFDLAKEWLQYAGSDLNTAKHMFDDVNPKETEISCDHAQQCAEKSLKAYLISKTIEPPYIHDLIELNNLCIVHDGKFSAIQQYCAFLNPYGVAIRYPNELAVDDVIAQSALEKAQIIYGFCTGKIVETNSDK
jgi:HEPN domain-containing protein